MRDRSLAAGRAIAAIAVVGALAASCSSGPAGESDGAADSGGTASGATDSGGTASAEAPGTPGSAPATAEQVAELTAVTKTYLTGVNNGDAPMLEHAMCQEMLAGFQDLSIGARPSPNPQQFVGISDVAVSGDSAFGVVDYRLVSTPEAPSLQAQMAYKYEDGWKVCAPV